MDLRERIVGPVMACHSQWSAAEKFAVAPSSAVWIVAFYAAVGSVVPNLWRAGRCSVLDAHRAHLVARIGEA